MLLGTVVVQVDVEAVEDGGRVELVAQQCDNATAIEESNKVEVAVEMVDAMVSYRKTTASTEAIKSGIAALLAVDDSGYQKTSNTRIIVIAVASVVLLTVTAIIIATVYFHRRRRAYRNRLDAVDKEMKQQTAWQSLQQELCLLVPNKDEADYGSDNF